MAVADAAKAAAAAAMAAATPQQTTVAPATGLTMPLAAAQATIPAVNLGAVPPMAALVPEATPVAAAGAGLVAAQPASLATAPATALTGSSGVAGLPPVSPAVETPDPRKVLVGNLPPDIASQTIEMVFNTYGRVISVTLLPHKSPAGQMLAVVEYDTPQAAEVAIVTLHQRYEIRVGFGPLIVQHSDQNSAQSVRYSPY